MTEPLAFKASYSDWKLIKTRGVVQVVMEVPLAEADAAYGVLGGMPDASREGWFAIAPIKIPTTPAEKEKPKTVSETIPATSRPDQPPAGVKRDARPWRDLSPSTQAFLNGKKPVFWAFLNETRGYAIKTPEDAAEAVREICVVASRALLDSEQAPRVIWHQLDTEFQAWERVGA